VLEGPAPVPTQTHAVWSDILDLSPGVRPTA
jgi:hypothetical protein